MAESDAKARAQILNIESALAAYRNSRALNASSGEITQQQPAFDSSLFPTIVSDSPLPAAPRKPGFSKADKVYLIEQFEKNRQILEVRFGNYEEKRCIWQAIADGLNERNPLTTRTAKEVRKKWQNLLIDAKKAYAECRRREENGMEPASVDPVIERIFAMYGGATPNGTDDLSAAINAAVFGDESSRCQMGGSESKSVLGSYLHKQTKAANNYSRNLLRNVGKTGDEDFQSSGNSNESAEAADCTNARLHKRIKLETAPRSIENSVGAIEPCYYTATPLHANDTHDASAYYQNEQESVMPALSPNFVYSELNPFPQFTLQSQRQNQVTNLWFQQQQKQLTVADDALPIYGTADKNEATKPSDDCQSLQLECLQWKKQNLILEQQRISLEKQKLSAEIAKINSEKEKIDLEIAIMKKRAHQEF